MIIDCHTHLNDPSDNAEVANLLDICQKTTACFVLEGSGSKTAADSNKFAELIRSNDKLIGFSNYSPLTNKINSDAVSAATTAAGIAGVVLYCAEEAFHPCNSRAMQFYEIAEQLGLTVFFHNSPPYSPQAVMAHAQPHLLDEVAINFPNLKIIIGSMGQPFLDQTLCMTAKHPNVYADLTIDPSKKWQLYNIVVAAHESSAMDKLLFGSGAPNAEPGNCIETLLGFNKLFAHTDLPSVPREKIRSIIERDTLALLNIKAG
jgi:hypothetical protein